ncbi:MAG TPA: YdiU family protein [Eubacteriaceae bacterium]|nr:YdiU family protein [Eubacteriaceae bacterium]
MTIEESIIDMGWNFDNSFASLPKVFYSKTKPTPVPTPKLVILNKSLAKNLGLDIEGLESAEGVEILVGNKIIKGALPLAQAYAGHQFGHFTMLGDGRAILLGEHITPKGDRLDIQLKGAGKTPYSRSGDGRAALGPMLREYIISEAMNGLKIPTTRSLAVLLTGKEVWRETKLPGAILVRVATSHLRVGTFEYISNWGSEEDLKILADYTIKRHFPNINLANNPYLELLNAVIKSQAQLIAKWQLVGFIHGVMNTDNMAISGETIDYGPCAFMDTYDPKTVFSSIDLSGRYSYKNQPAIGKWNLMRFAHTLIPLIDKNQDRSIGIIQDAISNFTDIFQSYWLDGMRAKLGIFNKEKKDESIVKRLLELMEKNRADFTITFRDLSQNKVSSHENDLYSTREFIQWYKSWQERLARQSETTESSLQLMKNNNPSIIPRNHRVEEALDAAVDNGDFYVMNDLLNALANPYEYSNYQEKYSNPPPCTDKPYMTFCGT